MSIRCMFSVTILVIIATISSSFRFSGLALRSVCFQKRGRLACEKVESSQRELVTQDSSSAKEREICENALRLLTELKNRCEKDKAIVEDAEAVLASNNQADVDSLNEMRKQREAEPYDMRLLGNLVRLFIDEVVDPVMAISWEVNEDTVNSTAEERSYRLYLKRIDRYASNIVCNQNPTPYNQLVLRHSSTIDPCEIVARMERVDRSLFPLTGVNVLDLAFANDAYRRHTMKAWECMYSNHPTSLDQFVTECEQCEWREEWRDLGTKMTRAVRAKLHSNDIQFGKVYADAPWWER